MVTPTISLDFGTLTEFKGTATSNITVYCTDSRNVRIRQVLTTSPSLTLSNGGEVELAVDGDPLNSSTLKLSSGDTTLQLSGTLKGTPTIKGAFSGTMILVIAIP